MIYLDWGATSFQKPPQVAEAMMQALASCASVGRGGYAQANKAAEVVYACRKRAGELFGADTEQVVFTSNCTHGLNIALRTLLKPGDRVAVSGFEHNAVMRPIYAIGARPVICGRKLFCWEDTLADFENALRRGVRAAVFTHVSNVFGYRLPVEKLAAMCRRYGVPFVVDAAQSAGTLPIDFRRWGADFVAMPGHKGLLGPQGTGILLCRNGGTPLLFGGTGSRSMEKTMPESLPERLEAGTMNVTGIAGLNAGLRYLQETGIAAVEEREKRLLKIAEKGLSGKGFRCFFGAHQSGLFSFVPGMGCEEMAQRLAERDIAVRAGLHCAPLAHESAGTLHTGTVRVSFGALTREEEVWKALLEFTKISSD